ncbi:hypothetical protein Tco_0743668 [Tanacetum coccineum]
MEKWNIASRIVPSIDHQRLIKMWKRLKVSDVIRDELYPHFRMKMEAKCQSLDKGGLVVKSSLNHNVQQISFTPLAVITPVSAFKIKENSIIRGKGIIAKQFFKKKNIPFRVIVVILNTRGIDPSEARKNIDLLHERVTIPSRDRDGEKTSINLPY